MKKIFLMLSLLIGILIYSTEYNVNSENFLNILKIAQDGDVLNVESSINIPNNYDSNYASVKIPGVTIKGNGHTVHLVGRPLSLTGNATFENINLSLLMPNAERPSNDASNLDNKTVPIYANGYDLTFDNVTTNVDGKPNNQPTIIMGNEKNGVGSGRDNKFEVKNQNKELNLKTIIAGSKEGNKQGKSTIILPDKVNLTSTGATILLKNLDNSGVFDVELNNKSEKVRTFDVGNNTNTKITIEDVKYDVGFKESEFKGKIKELILKNGASIYTDDDLSVGKVTLISENNESPKITVFRVEGDEYLGTSDKGSLTAEIIDASKAPNATIKLDNNANGKVDNVIGNFNVEGDRSKFTGYTENTNDNGTSTDEPNNDNISDLKQEYEEKVEAKTYLEEDQKTEFINKIADANTEDELLNIEREFNELDSLMKALKEAKQVLETTKNNEKYSDENFNSELKTAIEGLQEEYNNISNKIEKDKITELTTKYTEKNDEANTEIMRVTKLKEAISEIESYTNINQEEKEKYKNLVKQATNVDEIEAKKVEAKTRDNKKGELITLIEGKETLSLSQKSTLKEEVKNSNENNLELLNTKVNELEGKMQLLHNANVLLENIKSDLNYNSLNQDLKENVDRLLSSTQKEEITSTNKEEIERKKIELESKKTEVLQKIEELKTSKKNEIKEYLNTLIFLEEENKQSLISKIETTEDINKLEEIKQEAILKNTQDENVYKEQVKNALEKENLIQEQISKLEKEISDGTTKENIEAVKEKAKKLNEAMRELKLEKEKILQLKSNSNYSNEFDEAIDGLVSDTQNINKIETVSLISSLKEKIKEKIKEVNDKINEKTTLDEKKAEKKRELLESINLEQEQKNQFNNKIESANSESELEELKIEFNKLDSLMAELKTAKQKLETTKNNEKYNDENFNSELKIAVEGLQGEYNSVSNQIDKNRITELTAKYTLKNDEVNTEIMRVEKLNEVINEITGYTNISDVEKETYKSLFRSIKTVDEIENKKNEVKARNEKKGELINLIEGKGDLSSSQKNSLKEEVKNSNDANLEIFNTKINELAEEMKKLNDARVELEAVKNNVDYERLEQALKTAVENLISSSAKEQINSVDKNEIIAKKEELNNKKTEVLEKIKDLKSSKKLEISNLTGLTQEQKNKFITKIDELENLSGIEEIINKAKELDTEMLKLKPLKLKLEDLKTNVNLSEKDQNKVKEELIKYNDNIEKDKVQELINSFKLVIDLMELKIETKKEIESLSKLSNEQKNDLKSKVDDAENQEKINELKNSFVELTNSITSLKDSLEVLKSLKNEENREEIERLERESESKVSKQDIDAHKILVKQKIKEILKSYINHLSDLTKEQKEKLIQKITDASNYKDIKSEAVNLNDSMKKLNELKNKLTELQNDEKVTMLLNEINEAGKDINKKVIDELIEKIKKEIKKEIKIDLNKYKDYVKAFTYNDINVTKSFDEKTYFNFHLGKGNKNSLDDLGLIGGINTGFNIEVAKGIKVGAFVEYEKDLSHQISLGTNFKHKDGLAFIRYRLGIYDKLINHNIDLYGKYNKEIEVLKDLTITPAIGIYLSYSSKVEIDEYVRLNQRFIALGDLEAKINYNLYGIDLYATPLIKFGYNGAVLVNKINEKETLNAGVDYVIYGVNAGIKKSFLNGIVLKFDLGANANEKLDFKLKTDLGIGYNW